MSSGDPVIDELERQRLITLQARDALNNQATHAINTGIGQINMQEQANNADIAQRAAKFNLDPEFTKELQQQTNRGLASRRDSLQQGYNMSQAEDAWRRAQIDTYYNKAKTAAPFMNAARNASRSGGGGGGGGSSSGSSEEKQWQAKQRQEAMATLAREEAGVRKGAAEQERGAGKKQLIKAVTKVVRNPLGITNKKKRAQVHKGVVRGGANATRGQATPSVSDRLFVTNSGAIEKRIPGTTLSSDAPTVINNPKFVVGEDSTSGPLGRNIKSGLMGLRKAAAARPMAVTPRDQIARQLLLEEGFDPVDIYAAIPELSDQELADQQMQENSYQMKEELFPYQLEAAQSQADERTYEDGQEEIIAAAAADDEPPPGSAVSKKDWKKMQQWQRIAVIESMMENGY